MYECELRGILDEAKKWILRPNWCTPRTLNMHCHTHRHHPAKLAQAVRDVELVVPVRALLRLQRECHQRHSRRRLPRLQQPGPHQP